ncbi:16S rRNA (uracil(1498)-N(3))-methyltransferase [Listeria sp. PSOL-1]|uniref:16S rRNA (uracil(1498)-N(3))-methyltransferase n=1 Tax=Listeria sp. PSOL-1 TaxID=1844999 RepID=UPI0013D485B9|nr:16S rRNA (uracil(1498)-N(3))-methyltransferase [Listeria sp. PSOL-1]
MQRYFVEENLAEGRHVKIGGADHHHIIHVMRMKPEEQVILVGTDQVVRLATINEVGSNTVTLTLGETLTSEVELPIEITIASGLPKGDKLEWIVQKGTELGAAHFITFAAERSVSKWESKKSDKKLARLTKIAKEAAEQSHRLFVPTVCFYPHFENLVKDFQNYDYVICAYEESARANEKQELAKLFNKITPGQKLLCLFGPEGGIGQLELEQMQQGGALFVGLGPRILRTETAPLYLLAATSFHFELNL